MNKYPKNRKEIAERIKAKAGGKCERCGHVHERYIYITYDGTCYWSTDSPTPEQVELWYDSELMIYRENGDIFEELTGKNPLQWTSFKRL